MAMQSGFRVQGLGLFRVEGLQRAGRHHTTQRKSQHFKALAEPLHASVNHMSYASPTLDIQKL